MQQYVHRASRATCRSRKATVSVVTSNIGLLQNGKAMIASVNVRLQTLQSPVMAVLSCNHSVVTSQVEAGCLRGSLDEVQKAPKNRRDLTAFHFVASI